MPEKFTLKSKNSLLFYASSKISQQEKKNSTSLSPPTVTLVNPLYENCIFCVYDSQSLFEMSKKVMHILSIWEVRLADFKIRFWEVAIAARSKTLRSYVLLVVERIKGLKCDFVCFSQIS